MDNTVKARYELREGIQPPRRIAYSGVRAGTVLRTGVQNVQNVNQYSHPCNAQSKPNAVFRQRTRPKIPSEQAARRWNQRPLTTFGSRIETAPSSSTRMSWRHGGRITMTVTERKLAGEASKSVGGRAVAAVLDQSAADRSSEVTLEAAPRHGGTVPHGDAVTVIGRTQPAVADLNHRDSVEGHIERFPVLICRIRPSLRPDHRGTGPTPAYLAKASSLPNRFTSAVSPRIFAARSGPHPRISSRDGPAVGIMALIFRSSPTATCVR